MHDDPAVHRALHQISVAELVELIGIQQLQAGVAAMRIQLARVAAMQPQLARVLKNQEQMMADFTSFNEKLDEQSEALVDAQARISEDVQALQDQIAALELDTADQAQVDAAVTKLQASVDVLKGIDPVKSSDVPAPEPTPAPEPAPVDETGGV